MITIADHHYEQALAFLLDKEQPTESRDDVAHILIKMCASDREVFGATEDEWVQIKTEIFDAVVNYKKGSTISSQDK